MALGKGCLTGFIAHSSRQTMVKKPLVASHSTAQRRFYHQAETEVGGDLDNSVTTERVAEGWGKVFSFFPYFKQKIEIQELWAELCPRKS